jgi:hypothetical protein
VYPQKYEKRFGELQEYQINTVEKFLSCSNPHNGFSYVECSNENCGNNCVVPFSCKSEICPSCSEKQVLEFSNWVTTEVLFDVQHKHTVFTLWNPALLEKSKIFIPQGEQCQWKCVDIFKKSQNF